MMKKIPYILFLPLWVACGGPDNPYAKVHVEASEEGIEAMEEVSSMKELKKMEEAYWKKIFQAEKEYAIEISDMNAAIEAGCDDILNDYMAIEEAKIKFKLAKNLKKCALKEEEASGQ